MDKHLEVDAFPAIFFKLRIRMPFLIRCIQTLAAKHFGTKFVKADVANVPFLVVKLEIKVLPCVICFVDGVTKDK